MSNEEQFKKLKDTKDRLSTISVSFCLAKWLQSTTTLYNGYTHSCHHPSAHKIRIEDITKNYRGLHNTPTKIAARKDMLNGVRTKECQYCWNIESLGEEHYSDRIYKSSPTWSAPHFNYVVASGVGENIDPTYLEVAFESVCNFKCMYCTPDVSSKWMDEIQKFGPYKLPESNLYNSELHNLDWLKQTGRYPIHHTEVNPYIETFWKWWPELYEKLHTFRVTGGEPLLSKNMWRILDHIKENPRKELTLAVNTNMGVHDYIVDRLAEYTNDFVRSNKVRRFMVFTSAEAFGEQCEYIRFGMDWELFKSNVERFLATTDPEITVNFMVTVNVLSYSTFDKFLLWILELRKRFNTTAAHNRIPIMISYLRWPPMMEITQLPKHLKDQYLNKWLDIINANMDQEGRFYLEEKDQVERLIAFANSKEQAVDSKLHLRAFYEEYDRRRKCSLKQTFPEFYKSLHDAE